MTEVQENKIPTQETVEAFVRREQEYKEVESRVRFIIGKVDPLLKSVYKLPTNMLANYVYSFDTGKITFQVKVIELGKFNIDLEKFELPLACLWDATDLHINLNMLESDFADHYKDYAKRMKEATVEVPPSLWEKVKKFFKNLV